MTMYGPLLLILLVVGLLVGYALLRREMAGQIAELRKMVEESRATRSTETAAPVTAPVIEAPKLQPPKPDSKQKIVPAPVPAAPVKEEITPEILAVIAAAVAQFVGAGARIRSTRMVPMPESNAWAQQGRVIIQASHNLASY